MRQTIAKKLHNLNDVEFSILHDLNMRGYGQMQGILNDLYFGEDKDSWAIIHKVDGKVVGWAMIFDSFDIDHIAKKSLQLYVDHDWRRRGIGAKLIECARKRFSEFEVFPWDDQSRSFFSRVGVEVQYRDYGRKYKVARPTME